MSRRSPKLGDPRLARVDPPRVCEILRQSACVMEAYPEVHQGRGEPTMRERARTAQGYLNAAPEGIDARWVWSQGVYGEGLHFVDVERGWSQKHPSLPSTSLICNENNPGPAKDHGAAVLGVVTARICPGDIVGIAPKLSTIHLASTWRKGDRKSHVADALVAAIFDTPKPDVILIEEQLGRKLLPVEADPVIRLLISLATEQDIVVVEAAGNGAVDLDRWKSHTSIPDLSRRAQAYDSGAIMVGSAERDPDSDWKQLPNSNFGSRIDCYGPGAKIGTIGFGDDGTRAAAKRYTITFAGTSSAAAIVAGAALLLLGYAARRGYKLSPSEVRRLLCEQTRGVNTPVFPRNSRRGRDAALGVIPNLKNIIQKQFGPPRSTLLDRRKMGPGDQL